MNPDPGQNQNREKAERIAYLIATYLQGKLTVAEQDELDEWITESDENLELFEKLTDENNIDEAMEKYRAIEGSKSGAWEKLKHKMKKKKPGTLRQIGPWLVAASLVLVAATAYLLKHTVKDRADMPLAKRTTTKDRAAGTGKAVLTLSGGRTIMLDSTAAGRLGGEGGITISAAGQEITYNGTGTEMRYNTIATPRGGQYRLVLADGTRVWLNADSWLKFPAGFATAERAVELKGEAFFEVAKDPSRPFRVKILATAGEEGTVEVLGTQFNINAYKDEGYATTTLVEGAVRVQRGSEVQTMAPGQQAVLGKTIRLVTADVQEETAWKNGLFLFRNATTRSIAAQIRRWYDIEVEQVGANNQQFNLEVARNIPLSRLLEVLEKTGQVHFRLEHNKLKIQP